MTGEGAYCLPSLGEPCGNCHRCAPVTGEANGLRDEVARVLEDLCYRGKQLTPGHANALASFLLPLFERVQAEAWDKGYEDRERDERREQEHHAAPVKSGCDCMVPTENPYTA